MDTQGSDYIEERDSSLAQPADELSAQTGSSSIHRLSENPSDGQSESIVQGHNTNPEDPTENQPNNPGPESSTRKRGFSSISQNAPRGKERGIADPAIRSRNLSISENHSPHFWDAFRQMTRNIMEDTPWTTLQLISTSNEFTSEEKEL